MAGEMENHRCVVVRKTAGLIRHSLSSSQASSAQLHQPRLAANTAIKKVHAHNVAQQFAALMHPCFTLELAEEPNATGKFSEPSRGILAVQEKSAFPRRP